MISRFIAAIKRKIKHKMLTFIIDIVQYLVLHNNAVQSIIDFQASNMEADAKISRG